jgi:two-component system NtrC family sensor kinase
MARSVLGWGWDSGRQMKRARNLLLLLCLLLALGTMALGGLSVLRKVASFQPLGFEAAPAGVPSGVVRVGAVQDSRSGLARGDRILLVDGEEVGGAARLASRLREKPEAELAVVRGDQVLRLRYHRPPLAIDVAYLLLALIGVGYLLIGLYTLLRQPGGEGVLFCLWCMVSAALYLLTPVVPVDSQYRVVAIADELAHLFLPPLTLHLFLVFPSLLPAFAGRRRWLSFLYLPAAALLVLQLDLMLANGRWIFGRPTASAIQDLDRLDLFHLVAFALAAIGVLLYRWLREEGWEQRRQLQWVAFGLAGGYLPFFLLYGVPFALRLRVPDLLTAVAVLPLALVPLTFAYAILRYKLWDIEVIARDIVASALTLLLGVFGFSLVNLAITRGVAQEMALTRNLLSFAAGLVIAGLLVPTRRTLSSALERLQYGGRFGKRQALSGLGRDLLHERDLGRLCSALLDRMAAGMDLERLNLYLAQRDSLLAVRPEPELPAAVATTAIEPRLWNDSWRHLSGLGSPVAATSLEQRLFIAGYRYAFPLTVRARGVGLVLVGFKRDQMPLNSEDLELTRHLLNQAALAIENAQLLGQLHHQLEEVKRLQSYSDGIFESSPAGIAVLDTGERLVSANPVFALLVGQPREALLGRDLASILPDLPLPCCGEGPVEASFRDASGRQRHLQLSRADFSAGQPDGQQACSVLVVHDVSERVAMENALKEKDRLAALGMLAAGVAHEVNTPITGISSYAQMLLAETAESDPHYPILKKVERQTFRAARIVNNLLEFARNRQKERRPVAVQPLLSECLDLFGERLDGHGLEVAWEAAADASHRATVLGCDGELQQVFSNLIANALDAMAGQERGVLTLALETGERVVRIKVCDSGPGIPADKLETIFQPFYSTKLHRGGTGLGLAISNEIVARHGGTLRVTSTPGRGACFVVELPRYFSADPNVL